MKALANGWMLFGEYCRERGIPQNGNHQRKLDKLDPQWKENVMPTSGKKIWAVYVTEADKIFKGGN